MMMMIIEMIIRREVRPLANSDTVKFKCAGFLYLPITVAALSEA
jgi:hypothetical protein